MKKRLHRREDPNCLIERLPTLNRGNSHSNLKCQTLIDTEISTRSFVSPTANTFGPESHLKDLKNLKEPFLPRAGQKYLPCFHLASATRRPCRGHIEMLNTYESERTRQEIKGPALQKRKWEVAVHQQVSLSLSIKKYYIYIQVLSKLANFQETDGLDTASSTPRISTWLPAGKVARDLFCFRHQSSAALKNIPKTFKRRRNTHLSSVPMDLLGRSKAPRARTPQPHGKCVIVTGPNQTKAALVIPRAGSDRLEPLFRSI